jgi:hypothetical protein
MTLTATGSDVKYQHSRLPRTSYTNTNADYQLPVTAVNSYIDDSYAETILLQYLEKLVTELFPQYRLVSQSITDRQE